MIGKIKKVIAAIFKGIYKVLSVFNLQFTLLVGLVGVVLHFTGFLSSNGGVLIGYCIAFIGSVVLAVVLTIRKLLGIGKKPKEKKPVKIVNPEDKQTQAKQEIDDQPVAQPQPAPQPKASNQPTYYLVKQNSNYVMAEYDDRYELYRRTPNGLQKIRTDYKG